MDSAFTYRNEDVIDRTGFSGFLNTDTKEIIFCARTAHLDLINASGKVGYDGKPLNTGLDGIDGKLAYKMRGWTELRQWCAKQGWVHFVTNDEVTEAFFTCASEEQEKVCIALANEAGIPAVFKNQEFYKDTANG